MHTLKNGKRVIRGPVADLMYRQAYEAVERGCSLGQRQKNRPHDPHYSQPSCDTDIIMTQ